MTFPIAVGTGPRHSSSRPFPAVPRGHDIENEGQSGGREVQDDVIMAMGSNDDGSLTATVFISYHVLPISNGASNAAGNVDADGSEGGDCADGPSTEDVDFNVIAELRVQITPTTSPFASNLDAVSSSRETKSKVPLGIMRKRRRERRESCPAYSPNASVEFSSNETHLACIIPLPTSFEVISSSEHDATLSAGHTDASSEVVIFQVLAQKVTPREQSQRTKQRNLPRLPAYIVEKANDEDKSKADAEMERAKTTESNNDSRENGQEELDDSATASSTTRTFTSYVAHEPKIVRVPIPLNGAPPSSTNADGVPNTTFIRKLSGGASKHAARGVRDRTLQCASCMCSVPFDHHRGSSSSAVSMLLVGTTDGKALLVDFSTARVQSVVLECKSADCKGENRCQQISANGSGPEQSWAANPIVHLSQCTPTLWKPPDVYGEEQGSVSNGRLATVFRDGSVNIYAVSFVPSRSKHGRLEMRVELLATWSVATPPLRFMCAKWLNPLVVAILTRSEFLDEEVLRDKSAKAGASSSEGIVAQVWTIVEVVGNDEAAPSVDKARGWKVPSNTRGSIALISELKMPCGLDENVHDTFTLSPGQSRADAGRPSNGVFAECARGMSVEHHRATDCLTINSQQITRTTGSSARRLNVRPFCLIWDWKRNVPGLTLASSDTYSLFQGPDAEACNAPSLLSRFQLCEDDEIGLCAVHVYEQTSSAKRRRAAKNVFSLSTLSPPNTAAEGSLCVNDPSPLLLHRDSVTFPWLRKPSNTCDVTLQWEESEIPPAYTASNGPCRIAAMGKEHGRAIAVAASRGLCVLDLTRTPRLDSQHKSREKKNTPCATGQPGSALVTSPMPFLHPRWKQFGNVNDEQRFRAVSMVWWELGDEDLLLATVQYPDADPLHLACWSRKSLGFGEKQLLTDSSTHFAGDQEGDTAPQFGVALPLEMYAVQSMSVIADPADSSDRALLLLAYVSCHEGCSRMNYAVYQLQSTQSPNGKIERVLTKNSVCGQIPLQIGRSPDFSAPESVTGVFLAGGSFAFDLQADAANEEGDAFAVIGILTVFQGLVAVVVNSAGPILYRPSLLENACRQDETKGLIVSHWVSGTFSDSAGCHIAWNIAKNDGSVFCWSVPCRNTQSNHQPGVKSNDCSTLLPLGLERHSVLGDVCHLGNSSLWMNGGCTSEREIALGPFSPMAFGCTLYAGQVSKRTALAMATFHVSNFIVAPPQFTPFLFLSFLGLASASANGESEWQLIERSGKGAPRSLEESSRHARDRIRSILSNASSLGSSSSALRVVTLKVIELLNESRVAGDMKKGTHDNPSKETKQILQKWTLGKAVLREIVSAAKEIYDTLGFATFFLSVGRQLEPHQFNLIFPLPSVESPSKQLSLSSAEDLFSAACQSGSLATALSALPLFSDHRVSQQCVAKLVYHCLLKIGEDFQSTSPHTALTSREDEAYLHQLFWFGVKLEDAIETENSFDTEYESDSGSGSLVSASTFDESSVDEDDDGFISVSSSIEGGNSFETYSSEENEVSTSFLTPCRTPRKKPRVGIVKKVVRKLFQSEEPPPVNPLEENAINEAASSFILSGFDGLAIENPASKQNGDARELVPDGNTLSRDEFNAADPSTVAGAVCVFLQHAVAFGGCHQSSTLDFGWKVVSAVAHLLQGERETAAITSAGSANARSISCSVTVDDFLAEAAQPAEIECEEDHCKAIARMIRKLTSECGSQIHSDAIRAVFNLILLLLLRYETCPDVQRCKATLIVVGIVAGKLGGRIEELLDLQASCDVNTIYSALVADS